MDPVRRSSNRNRVRQPPPENNRAVERNRDAQKAAQTRRVEVPRDEYNEETTTARTRDPRAQDDRFEVGADPAKLEQRDKVFTAALETGNLQAAVDAAKAPLNMNGAEVEQSPEVALPAVQRASQGLNGAMVAINDATNSLKP